MDDLETELMAPEIHGEHRSSDGDSVAKKRKRLPLAPTLFKEPNSKEVGFRKTATICLQQIREAMLHHQWQEAAEYMPGYFQSLEDDRNGKNQLVSKMIWRMGTEILHHHPNSKMEDYNSLYERMKHSGVLHFLVVSLEHSLHLLVNGQLEDAKRQLSSAESWRYGKLSAGQSHRINLIQAYRGYLDYFIWCEKKSTLSSTDDADAGANQEMHNYFRQSCVNLKEIIKTPGIWDPFVLSYIHMLEFYNDQEGALKVLNDYAYDSSFPPNPNAHVYLYWYLKRHDAPHKKLMQVLKILHALVPSHELMLEYCSLLLQSERQGDLQKALRVSLDLLDYACWNCLDAWDRLKTILSRLRSVEKCSEVIEEVMMPRKDWWPALHFTPSHARREFAENRKMMDIKVSVVGDLCPSAHAYYDTAKTLKKRTNKKKPLRLITAKEQRRNKGRSRLNEHPAFRDPGTETRDPGTEKRDPGTETQQRAQPPPQRAQPPQAPCVPGPKGTRRSGRLADLSAVGV